MKAARIFLSIFFIVILLTTTVVDAKAVKKEAIIAEFTVCLNGILINNINSDYPLLVYKDITYFPLTWDYSRFLGLETLWDSSTGLSVNKIRNRHEFSPLENTIHQLGKKVSITIPNYAITINGDKINNISEPWPLINYNGITYFPLTWRFAVDYFGWDYHWSQQQGLSISIPEGQTNPKETVLSIINRMRFGKGYHFVADITNLNNKETLANLTGKLENSIDQNFSSSIKLYYPQGYGGFRVDTVKAQYTGLNPRNREEGAAFTFHANDENPNIGRVIGSDLMVSEELKMIIHLFDLHFTGSDRQQIKSFDNVQTSGDRTQWLIKTDDKKFLLELDHRQNKIITIELTDGVYIYKIKPNLINT